MALSELFNRHLEDPIAVIQQTPLAVAAVLFSPFLLTYAYTSFKSRKAEGTDGSDAPVPVEPYWVPWLGNTLPFASNTGSFLRTIRDKFGMTPVRLLVGGQNMTFIPHGDKMITSFLNSRDFHTKPLSLKHQRDTFGACESDLEKHKRDDSGIFKDPNPGSQVDPADRVMYLEHRNFHEYLDGPNLTVLIDKTLEFFVNSVNARTAAMPDWVEIPDLYEFIRDELFDATVRALCGEELFRAAPTFTSDFWVFDEQITELFKGLPRWMIPKAYASREKMKTHLLRWHEAVAQQVDMQDDQERLKSIWDPVLGFRLLTTKHEILRSAMSMDGTTRMELATIWASLSNVIPSAFWPILNTASSPNLTERVLVETAAVFPGGDLASFDRAKLNSMPLINSMYMESLRLGTAVALARAPAKPRVRMGRWSFAGDEMLFALNWQGAHDEAFWNQGARAAAGGDGSRPEHPVSSFWAERFLEYPDDPLSGPIRKEAAADAKTPSPQKPRAPKTPADDAAAKLATSGLGAHYFPYGGGAKMCPGRHFAKQEILACIAVILRAYDIELLDPAGAASAKPDTKYFMTGSMPPDRKIPARVRRRRTAL